MRITVAWVLKNLLLPLLPFGLGALIRILSALSIDRSAFDPADLSFSLAILCLLVSVSARKLQDPHTSSSISSMFIMFGCLFLTLFAITTLWKFDADATSAGMLEDARRYISSGGTSIAAVGDVVTRTQFVSTLQRIDAVRQITFIVAGFVIFLAIVCEYRYKLED